MKKPRGGIRSTRREHKDEFEKELEEQLILDKDMHPTAGSTTSEGVPTNNNVFCFAALAEKEKGTVYTDATGALPVMSLDGHQYYIVAYDYDNNFIEAKEVSDLKDETIVETVQKVFDEMEARGHPQAVAECYRQPSSPANESIFENEGMQVAIFRTPQSSSKCGRASDPNFQEPPHQRFLLHRQRVATAVME